MISINMCIHLCHAERLSNDLSWVGINTSHFFLMLLKYRVNRSGWTVDVVYVKDMHYHYHFLEAVVHARMSTVFLNVKLPYTNRSSHVIRFAFCSHFIFKTRQRNGDFSFYTKCNNMLFVLLSMITMFTRTQFSRWVL